MAKYKRSINLAMGHIQTAKEHFALCHELDFDVDWAMEQFDHALDILERLKGYEPQELGEYDD